MATLVQAQIVESTTTNPSSVAFSPATTIGNKIIVRTAGDHSGTINAVTAVSGGGVSSFTEDIDQAGSDGTLGHALQCWSGTVTSSVTTAISLGWSTADNTHIFWVVEEWSGLGAFDKASTIALAVSTAPLSGSSGTLANADSTVFGWGNWRTAGSLATATVGAGYSGFLTGGSSTGNIMGAAFESKQVAATTATTANVTLSTSNGWGFIVAAYQNAAVSTTASPQPFQGLPEQPVMRSHFW